MSSSEEPSRIRTRRTFHVDAHRFFAAAAPGGGASRAVDAIRRFRFSDASQVLLHTDGGSATIRADQFALIGDFVGRHSRGGAWILAGDLNVRGDRQVPARPAEDQYSRMMESLGMPRDLWTASYFLTGEPGYTWAPGSNTFNDDDSGDRKRLDYILVGVPRMQPPPPVTRAR